TGRARIARPSARPMESLASDSPPTGAQLQLAPSASARAEAAPWNVSGAEDPLSTLPGPPARNQAPARKPANTPSTPKSRQSRKRSTRIPLRPSVPHGTVVDDGPRRDRELRAVGSRRTRRARGWAPRRSVWASRALDLRAARREVPRVRSPLLLTV